MLAVNLFGSKITIHYYNLSLALIPVIAGLTFGLQGSSKYIYVPISMSLCSIILFLNFPSIVITLHSRPIYYDDLVIKDYNEDEAKKYYDNTFRKKYQKVFKYTIAVTSSILVGITTELWYHSSEIFNDSTANSKKKNSLMNFVFVISIIGGLLRMYYAATLAIGKLIMFILKFIKKREQNKLIEQEKKRMQYIVTDYGVAQDGAGRVRQTSVQTQERPDERPMIKRSSSCSDITVIGLKPTLMASMDMTDIFSEYSVEDSEDEN